MTLMTSDHHQVWHTDREYEYDGLYDVFFLMILWEIVTSV